MSHGAEELRHAVEVHKHAADNHRKVVVVVVVVVVVGVGKKDHLVVEDENNNFEQAVDEIGVDIEHIAPSFFDNSHKPLKTCY
jgi:hypothetical protein